MHIGDLDLGDRPLFLAPMEDITDPSFRYLCKQFGADVMYTEFISSDGLIRDGAKSVKKLDIYDYERPMGIQLYGHLVDSMVEATHRAVEAKPEIIDINFGCPVRKIANRGAGAGMLANIVNFTTAIRAGLLMGVWGMANQIGHAFGSLMGGGVVDVVQSITGGNALAAYATVFALEVIMLIVALILTTRLDVAESQVQVEEKTQLDGVAA